MDLMFFSFTVRNVVFLYINFILFTLALQPGSGPLFYTFLQIFLMEEQSTLLEGYSDQEKGAYLGAIASLATADREASAEEMEHIEALCEAAKLSPEQTAAVRQAATEMSGNELNQCLDVLKNSELKYSLVTDLMAFAKADNDYSEEEEQNIHKISQYLGVDQQQFSLLNQFSQQAATNAGQQDAAQQAPAQQNFFGGGLQQKMQNAGINTGSLMKGVLAIAAPMLLGRMFSRGRGMRGGFGGGLGGMLGGGLGGMMMGGGGLGSLIGMLSGGRGMRSTGGLLGKILGRRF
jgi:uncharacterized tellurite resistance protein B-like protein